jgi:predicted hydrocarbon binding protein
MTSSTPVCGHIVGELQYFVEWITGHEHKVEEIECRAAGHPADVFRVEKTALMRED